LDLALETLLLKPWSIVEILLLDPHLDHPLDPLLVLILLQFLELREIFPAMMVLRQLPTKVLLTSEADHPLDLLLVLILLQFLELRETFPAMMVLRQLPTKVLLTSEADLHLDLPLPLNHLLPRNFPLNNQLSSLKLKLLLIKLKRLSKTLATSPLSNLVPMLLSPITELELETMELLSLIPVATLPLLLSIFCDKGQNLQISDN